MQFLDGAGVQQGELAVFQARASLAGEQQALNFGRRQALAARRGIGNLQIEPLLSRRRDLEAGLDAFEFFGAVMEAFVEGDTPFSLQAGIVPREEIQNGVLAVQMIGAG